MAQGFLATTALEECWETSGKVFFLGEWCKLFQRRELWRKLDFEVLPYHWDDRRKLSSDFQYLNAVYEVYLRSLSAKLNAALGTSHQERYWRIIIGPWLRYFVEILFDRFACLSAATTGGRNLATIIVPEETEKFVPRDFAQFSEWFTGDLYNLYLYSRIIEKLGGFQYEYKQMGRTEMNVMIGLEMKRNGTGESHHWGQRVRQRLGRWRRPFVFVTSYFDRSDLFKLQLSLLQLPLPVAVEGPTSEPRADVPLRNSLGLNGGWDKFTKILDQLIPLSIPMVYLEHHSETAETARAALPPKPRVILTANAYSSNEPFKFWAAHYVSRGAKLIILQHGGHYGTGLFSGTENHELAIADKYISWGWMAKDSQRVVPLPAQRLRSMRVPKNRSMGKKIYWNLNIAPRYSYRLFSTPIGPQWIEYIQSQIEFGQRLDPEVRTNVLCRAYSTDYSWDVITRMEERLPDVEIRMFTRPWQMELRNARLAIETTNFTTLLESLAANIPTVLFLDQRYWELRESAQVEFEQLRKVGIYHTSASSAAEMVNKIWGDPMVWWYQPALQMARARFCRKFAHTNRHWLCEWRNELRRLDRDERASHSVDIRFDTPELPSKKG